MYREKKWEKKGKKCEERGFESIICIKLDELLITLYHIIGRFRGRVGVNPSPIITKNKGLILR